MRILFFIGGLGTGGAERQIAQLSDGLARRGHAVTVATIFPGGQNWEWLQKQGSTSLLSLFDKKAASFIVIAWQLALAVIRLRKIIYRERITFTYSALYLSNVIAWLAVLGMRHVYLIMGIRASNLESNWKRAIPFHICRMVSFSVPILIANSTAGLKFHEDKGYKSKIHYVIPNGININRFKFDAKERDRLRLEWGIGNQVKLIGMVGRLDPMKDHSTFLRAAAIVAQKRNDVRFVCVGDGKEMYRTELHRLSEELGLTNSVIWAGDRHDMHNIYSALDIATSSSAYGEGFPNCVGEAMACGVPCVVTDVGDSAQIVNDTGIVVKPKRPEQLAEALLQIVSLNNIQRNTMGKAARSRIENKFSVTSAVMATEDALFRVSGKQATVNE